MGRGNVLGSRRSLLTPGHHVGYPPRFPGDDQWWAKKDLFCTSRRWDRVSREPVRASDGQAPPAARSPNQEQNLELAVNSLLKKRLGAALCERRRLYFCGNPAVTDRRYSLKRVF